MSTHLYKPVTLNTIANKLLPAKKVRFICFLPLFFIFCPLAAQQKQPAPIKYSQADLENLFNTCQQAREDTVTRLLLGFLSRNNLRKNAPAFYGFCSSFKTLCIKNNNQLVLRRLSVLELHNRLRLNNTDDTQVNKAFENLYQDFLDKNDYPAALECLFELGLFHHRLKNNIAAIKVLFFAEKVAVKYMLQQKISYQGILHYIGYILWDLDKPLQSINYFKKSLATGSVIVRDSMVAMNGLGMNYQKIDSLKQSLYYFNEASRIAMSTQNEVFNTVVLGSASVTLLKLEETDKAYDYCMQYKNLSVQYPLWENAVDAFYRLIQIELKRSNTTHAKILLDSLNGIMNNISNADYVSLRKQREAVYFYYEKLKQYDKALPAYKAFVHYDSLFQNYSNKNKISELEVDAQLRLYEEDMLNRGKAKKIKDIVEIIVAITLLFIVVLIVRYGYRKIKHAQNEKSETDKINFDQAAEIEKLKEQVLAQLSTIRNDNINFQLLLAKQSSSKGNAETVVEEMLIDDAADITNTESKNPNIIQALKEFSLTEKENWKEFKMLFSKIYPNFETNIIGKIATVSTAELRLMMLHKLKLSNKEIAQTLHISPDSVKKGNYRLYKKIGINSAAELDDFLL